MVRRSQRHLSEETKGKLLKAIGNCRDASIELTANAPIGGEEYVAADKLRTALDDMTGTLTGDREHFRMKSHSTHPHTHGRRDDP